MEPKASREIDNIWNAAADFIVTNLQTGRDYTQCESMTLSKTNKTACKDGMNLRTFQK